MEWEGRTGKWKRHAHGEGKEERCKRYKKLKDVTNHHAKIHCSIKGQKLFYSPYSLSTTRDFGGLKAHMLKGHCRTLMGSEIDRTTWCDIILVNACTTLEYREDLSAKWRTRK